MEFLNLNLTFLMSLYSIQQQTMIVLYVGTDRLNERKSTQVVPDFLSYAGYAL